VLIAVAEAQLDSRGYNILMGVKLQGLTSPDDWSGADNERLHLPAHFG
jgi:hypothetical protein